MTAVEPLLSKRVDGPVPLYHNPAIHIPRSMDSTSKAMDLPQYVPSKPQLIPPDAPKENIQIALAKLVNTLNQIRAITMRENHDRITFKTGEIVKLQKKTQSLQSEKKGAEEAHTFWSFLKKVATVLLTAVSIISGAVLCATGLAPAIIAGGLLIGSGVTGITAFALSESGADPRLCAALGIASAGLGVAGSIVCFSSVAHALPKMIAAIGAAVTGVASGTTTIGTSIWESKTYDLRAQLAHFQGKSAISQERLNRISLKIREVLDRIADPENAAIRTAQLQNEASSQILREIQG